MKALSKLGVFLASLILFVFCFFIGVSLTQTTPKVANFFTGISSWEYSIQGQTVVYYSDGTEMGKLGYQRQYSEDFPDFLKKAVVAVEDHRFYQHSGFDAKSIGRALYNDLRAGSKAEGGSTITQQLARTIFLNNEKSFSRKVKELFIAVSIEDKYTKDAILNMYLNEIYMGRGCSGMACAANSYFGKNVSQLNKAEITMLTGIIQSPEHYSPDENMEGIKARQETVVRLLVEQEIITSAEGEQIMQQKLDIKPFKSSASKHPYYMSYLSSVLEGKIGAQKLYGGGLKVYTTIDRSMQESAEATVTAHAQTFKNRGITAQDIALVSVEPQTGAIKAMVGGTDWSKNQINMAVIARQPGSVIKPLYYAAAINEGIIKADTQINNKKRDFGGYAPDNYSASPEKVTVREALLYSYNVASVEVLNKLGVDKAIEYLEQYGITSLEGQDHNLALALGGMTRGISPLQMASAYGVFPNNGKCTAGFTVSKVTDAKNKNIYKDASVSQRVISGSSAKAMDNILKAVVSQGTGKNASIAISSGGKTGTTEGVAGNKTSRDLWYVGYTSELVTSVWVGNSDNSEIKGFATYGGSVAGPIWRDYMNKLIDKSALQEAPRRHDEEKNEEEEPAPTEITEPDDDADDSETDGNEGDDAKPDDNDGDKFQPDDNDADNEQPDDNDADGGSAIPEPGNDGDFQPGAFHPDSEQEPDAQFTFG